MKQVVFGLTMVAMLLFVNAELFAQKNGIAITPLSAKDANDFLQNANGKKMDIALQAREFKKGDILNASLYKGTDAKGAFEMTVVAQSLTNKLGKQFDRTHIEIKRNGLVVKTIDVVESDDLRIDYDPRNGNVNSRSRTSNGTDSEVTATDCISAAFSGVPNCRSCIADVKDCIKENKKVWKKIVCMISALDDCISCAVDIATLIECASQE